MAGREATAMRSWENYDCHPEIGPKIEEYRAYMRDLEFVKQGLRTRDNIEEIMEMSYEAAEIKRSIDGLVDLQEQEIAARNRDTLWLYATGIALGVGVANVLIALGVF